MACIGIVQVDAFPRRRGVDNVKQCNKSGDKRQCATKRGGGGGGGDLAADGNPLCVPHDTMCGKLIGRFSASSAKGGELGMQGRRDCNRKDA